MPIFQHPGIAAALSMEQHCFRPSAAHFALRTRQCCKIFVLVEGFDISFLQLLVKPPSEALRRHLVCHQFGRGTHKSSWKETRCCRHRTKGSAAVWTVFCRFGLRKANGFQRIWIVNSRQGGISATYTMCSTYTMYIS